MKALDVFCRIVGILFAVAAFLFVVAGVYHTVNQNEFLLTVQNGGVPCKIVKTNKGVLKALNSF